ncbi:hypothetical protein C1H84_16985 [Glutamicibacter soli]|uniref:Uncharacterized protein n=1 Tax=Glutamicibacter soli TaxID=453836 RepID=A0A365Y8E1_9MICC|nr:hypothetical protein [Glutamicibacter soli]RBL98931.1 hypothetical protein C1H84_16985 [Glutamicibacter soli]
MTSISDAYGITGQVPFEDLDIDSDNRRFLDPRVIRINASTCPHADAAVKLIDSFFNEVTASALSLNTSTRTRGRELLTRFEEPWETRLGYASKGFQGHGAAQSIGGDIWDELSTNLQPLLEIGFLKHLEALPLFIENVGADRTSDISTRIVYDALCNFTHQMAARYPTFATQGDGIKPVMRQFWDPVSSDWVLRIVELPHWNGKPLVLVPKNWTRRNLLMTHGRYYETSLLTFVQDSQSYFKPDGKVLKPTKGLLKTNPLFQRSRETTLRVTLDAASNGTNLYERFETFVNDKYAA